MDFNIAGLILGVKTVNGRIKPKFGKKAIVGIFFMILLCLATLVGFVFALINGSSEWIIMCGIGFAAFIYLFLISPYTQNSRNYQIEFLSDNSLNGFNLFYKNKAVIVKYKLDNQGKFAFANDAKKLDCILYADGSKMGNFTKYRILNYFGKWLHDNGLMSAKITTSFE